MPDHDQHDHDPDGRFADELGSVLRSTGESFALDGRPELVTGGLARGRRRLLRRRLAVTGGALALAAIGVGGVYAGSVVTPAGPADKASVAGAPERDRSATRQVTPAAPRPGEAEIPLSEIAEVLKANTPPGEWRFDGLDGLDGKGQGISGVYDDGKGEAAFSVHLARAGRTAEAGVDQVTCPSKTFVPHDHCTDGTLPDGGRFMVFQGYEYPDKREETKNWRAVLLTEDGFLVDASEYNAAAQKGAVVGREDPPLDATQLKALVTAEAWRPLLEQIPPLPTTPAGPGVKPGAEALVKPGVTRKAPSQVTGDVPGTLRALLPEGLRVVEKGGEGEYGYVVVDDGNGRSFVQINVQYGMGGAARDLYGSGDVTTLPGGGKLKLTRQPGEKGGAGVVWWSADTMTKKGFRVVVSAFNTGAQHEPATRAEPALTMEQLKAIALDPKWAKLPAR
ncbi:hypothetical protein ACFWIN_12430 [Streptomyces sp. NPDC127049]|uniref:hypothetical protein n=1 Tax=Streptomyces sp. NPDC127049 TaxID=3347118 RepID=UPI0036679185